MNGEKFKELDDAYIAYNNEDVDTAIKLYESAARRGSILAIIQLIYIYGNYHANNNRFDFWKNKIIKLSEYDNIAQFGLANFYFEGVFGRVDKKAGMDNLLRSANSGYADAQYQLADLHCSGLYDAIVSTEYASYWLRRAYKNRHPGAYYEISCYYGNNGKNKKSEELLKKSAKLGFGQAQDILGEGKY